MGIGMVVHDHLGFGHFWMVAGLVGYAATFAPARRSCRPSQTRVGASAETNGPEQPTTLALIDRILLVAHVDVPVLLLVVADMTLKPFS
jgi:hypothetical protein